MNANVGAIARLSLQRIRCAGALAVLLVASIAPLYAEAQEKDWNAVIAAAKKEGKVVVYGTSSFREILDKAKPIFSKSAMGSKSKLSPAAPEKSESGYKQKSGPKGRTLTCFRRGLTSHCPMCSVPMLWINGDRRPLRSCIRIS